MGELNNTQIRYEVEQLEMFIGMIEVYLEGLKDEIKILKLKLGDQDD